MKHNFRIVIALTLWGLTASISAQNPQPTLTISQALERGIPQLQTIFEGRSALAESAILRQGTWDNPQLLVSSEHTRQAGVSIQENYLLVSQRIELFGIQRLRTQAARHHRNAVLFQNKSRLLDTKALIKEWFYEVLYFQARVNILAGWESKAETIANIISLREKAGQVSGYDRRRLLRELSEARAMITRDRALHAGRWDQLRTLLALDEDYTLSGTLLPALSNGDISLSRQPEFLAFDQEIKAASLQAMAARRWKLPEITVEAGLKNTSIAGEKDHGVFLSARLPLPVFNRKKSQLKQAGARIMIARGEKALARAKAEGRLRALRKQIHLLRAAIGPFRKEAIETSQELVSIAGLAYREGEMEILTLLDAFRSLRDAELKAVAMEAEIRRLMIEFERLGGEK